MASDRAIRPAQGPSKGFIIAGPASGVGKTTVALSLMAALRRRGLASGLATRPTTQSQSTHSATNRVKFAQGINDRIAVPNPHPHNVTVTMSVTRTAMCRNGR